MSRPPRKGSSGRRAKEERRNNAMLRDLFARLGDRPLPDPPTVGPRGRPIIPDADVVGGGPRLVLVRCKLCGNPMRGVRRSGNGRLVFGMPWVELATDGAAIFAVTCRECGQERPVREQELLREAAVAEKDAAKARTIRA